MRKIGQIYSKPSVKIQDLENKQATARLIHFFLTVECLYKMVYL